MTRFWEPRWHFRERRLRDTNRYPELQFSDPAELGRIDQANARDRLPLTSLGTQAVDNVLRAGISPEERRQIELATAMDEELAAPRIPAQPRTESPFAIQAFREQMGLNEPEDDGGVGGFLGRALDVGTRNPFSLPGIARGAFDLGSGVTGAAVDIVRGDTPDIPTPIDIVEEGIVEGVNTARNTFAPSQALDLVRDRDQAESIADVPGTLLGGLQDVDIATGLPFRTPIRQGSQTLTDPAGAFREQFEQEEQGGIGFGLEGSAAAEQFRRIPGIERDIPGTEISAFDLGLGLSDALLDVGGVAGLAEGSRVLLRSTAIRSVLPTLSDDTALLAARQSGAAGPTLLDPGAARTIVSGSAARNAVETASRQGDQVGSEALRTLDAAGVMVRQDKPGVIGGLLNQIPGLRSIRAFDQPRFNMPDDILESAVGRQMGMAEYHTVALGTREPALRAVDNVFGDGASDGLRVSVRFLGDDDGYPAIGTVYDIFQRPDLYDLTDTQRAVIRHLDNRNLTLRTLANDGYGTSIARFSAARPGAAYLPNVDASDAARQLQELTQRSGTRSIAGTRSKPRVFDTGYERWLNDTARAARGELEEAQVFIPETNIRQLIVGLDGQKANAVGSAIWQQGVPGRTLLEVNESVAPQLVDARNGLRRQIDSLRGKIRRAEQSISRDQTTARALERQIAENDARLSRALDTAAQSEGGLPELDALRGVIDELELRQASLNRAATTPSARFSRQAQRVDDLRSELADVLDQYTEVRRAYEAVNLRGEQFVGEGIFRYFPADQAQQLRDLSRISGNRVFELMARANATVLSGDLSPAIGIHGQLAFLLRPADTTIKMFGALADPTAAFRLGKLADDIAADPDGWQRFAFWLGRPIAGTQAVPDELAGGFLGKLPGFSEANAGMYRVALRRMKDDFDWFARKAIDDGAALDEAYAAAIDTVTKVFPTLSPARLGQSAAQATAQRAPFTSIAFLRQPAALVQEGTKALMKTALRQPLTLREEFAREAILRIAGTSITTISVAAYLDAELKGLDKTDHITNAVKQGRVHVPGTKFSFPLGATFRGIYNAVKPQQVDVEGVGEVWLPFVGVPQFFESRIAPVIATQRDLLENEDYFGNPIVTSDFPVNILEALSYERNAFFPIAAQGVTENVIEGESADVILAEAAGELLGGNLTAAPEFIQEQETKDSIARGTEWTDPQTGEPFRVDSFDELSSRVGSVVADQMIAEQGSDRLEGLQESQAEESRETATGVDDPEQAFAQLDALGQERLDWAMRIQQRINTEELTLADARRLEKERNWNGEVAGVIRSFQPVFEQADPLPLDQVAQMDDVNDVRAQYFAYLDQNIDPDTGKPTDEFYDEFEPRFIAAIGEDMWDRVQDNIGTRNRAPWQLELRQLREELAQTGYWDLQSEAWSVFEFPEATRFDSHFDWKAEKRRDIAAEFNPSIPRSTIERAVDKAVNAHPITKAYQEILTGLENPWVAQNSQLADRAVQAGYFTATDPQLAVIRFNLTGG